MKKLSLSIRLILYFILIALLSGSAAGVLSWKETREKINEFFDTYQMALARQLAAADWSNASPEIQRRTNKLIKKVEDADDEEEAIGFAVFDDQGKMVFNDGEKGKYFKFMPFTGRFYNEKLNGKDEWHILSVKSADGNYVIMVGQETEYREDVVWEMAEEFIIPWAAGLGLLLLTMIIIIMLEFLPLKRLAAAISQRNGDDLSPLPKDEMPHEVQPLINAMNKLLEQISVMLMRERRFIADSAHELRTPLTALKVQLEVAQMAGDDEKMREQALQKLGNGIERSSRLVEQLLVLSRLEAAEEKSEKTAIDWDTILARLLEDYAADIKLKNLKTVCKLSAQFPIKQGNPLLAALLLRNLLDNAVKYSPSGALITVESTANSLRVINSGSKVEEKHLDNLTRRFFRPAGQKQAGSGLGLAIAEQIAGIFGCRITFSNTPRGFCAEVSLR